MTLARYFEREQDDTGQQLHWGIADVTGLPIRGDTPPALKPEEIDDLPIEHDVRVQLFDLTKEEDKQAYQTILERAANGWYKVSFRQFRWAPEGDGAQIYCEWIQSYNRVDKKLMQVWNT